MISRRWSGLGPVGMVRNVVGRVKPVYARYTTKLRKDI
jgi:hypothetical protein